MNPSGAAAGLSAGGIVFMLLAWGGIIGVTLYCFYKLLKTKDRKR
jgi:hypothetical protein